MMPLSDPPRAHLLYLQAQQLLHDGRLAGRRGQRAVQRGQQRVDHLECSAAGRPRRRAGLLQRAAERLSRLRAAAAVALRMNADDPLLCASSIDSEGDCVGLCTVAARKSCRGPAGHRHTRIDGLACSRYGRQCSGTGLLATRPCHQQHVLSLQSPCHAGKQGVVSAGAWMKKGRTAMLDATRLSSESEPQE